MISIIFHKSAIIVLFFYIPYILFKGKIKFNKDFYVLYGVLLSFFMIFGIQLFLNFFIQDTEYMYYIVVRDVKISSSSYLIILITIIISLINYDKIKKILKDVDIFTFSLIVAISCYFIQYSFSMGYRMLLFFLPILYTYLGELKKKVLIDINIESMVVKFIINAFFIYKIANFFMIQLGSAQII